MSSCDLKKAGLKVTLPRLKILDVLRETEKHSNDHFTAEEIHQRLNDAGEEIGLATVYRVLTQFEEAGLVRRHHFDGGQSLFERDLGDQHDHIKCVECGLIDEFAHEIIQAKQEEIARSLGFVLQESRTILFGICKKCQEAAE